MARLGGLGRRPPDRRSGGGPAHPVTSPEDAVVAVWQLESPRIVSGLLRITRDLQLAEDLAQDALVAALEAWPRDGVPANPGAWLMTVAKRRAIDTFRRAERHRAEVNRLGHEMTEESVGELVDQVDHVEDDVLRLMFLTCHPALTAESRAALTLRLVGGLTVEEIARGFQVKDTAVGQRISRAKKTLAESGASLEMPIGAERASRLDDVMAVVYLVFNEGYAATSGDSWMRTDLCLEALRLARMLAALAPSDAEVHGLQALLELQASRFHARTSSSGEPVLLEDQDRARWDHLLIRRGLAALARAESSGQPVGVYTVQAAIAACHARARRAADTDWVRIASLYDLLSSVGDNPAVEVNRAVAHGRAFGPSAGLAVLDAVESSSYAWHAVRGDLLARAGRGSEAADSFRLAASLTRNEAERVLLLRRAATSESGGA
ncbi:sigma-70 family RNA polymerase sigma factor [Nocardioides islandensis]|uniref:RNA polymerase sigma factor n=1 Tax=Nocardioides islandensis TaxID=433663 RepID=A0A930YD55_9ACTN|nr:sigma-70 family RNA polymerase sigma factor [Nocardioides islandensis]